MKNKIPLNLPDNIRPLVLRFAGQCKCSKSLRKGQSAFYDMNSRKPLCKTCAAEGNHIPAETGDRVSWLIDRITALMAMPLPRAEQDQEELKATVRELCRTHADNERARQILVEFYEIELTGGMRCICLKHGEPCHECEDRLKPGSAAIWDPISRRTRCLDCASVISSSAPPD